MTNWVTIMLSCKEATKLISESLDRPLSLRQRISVAMHVLMCRFCARYRRQLQLMRLALNGLAKDKGRSLEATPDDSLSPEARERIKEDLRRDSQ